MMLIADIVTSVMATPAPVLFLDSCILLNIVEAPYSNKPDEVRFSQLLLASALKNPKTIHLFAPSPVPKEWDSNIQKTENLCIKTVFACNAVASICGHLGLPAVGLLPPAVLTLPALLRKLSAHLLAACVIIDHHDKALGRAADRIIANAHPVSEPHSKGAKDSIILEHAVETAAQLQNAGFSGISLFVSSNTKDFADPGSTNLHTKLRGAFDSVKLQYAVSLVHAERILAASGWVP